MEECGICPWCNEERTLHKEAEVSSVAIFKRDLYRCTTCNKLCKHCRVCRLISSRFARVSSRGREDAVCDKCDILCKYSNNEKQEEKLCSWCFKTSTFTIEERNSNFLLRRNAYFCQNCCKIGLPCRTSTCNSMARGSSTWDDDYCYICSGHIEIDDNGKINVSNEKIISDERYCSWCCKKSKYMFIEKNLALRRDIYACSECGNRTLVCIKCDIAMAQGGTWDNFLCSACYLNNKGIFKQESYNWDIWKANVQRFYELGNSISPDILLNFNSIEKEIAASKGMLRPFLCIISMEPMQLIKLSGLLGISFFTISMLEWLNEDRITDDYIEKIHEISLRLILCNRKGIIARTNRTRETINILGHDTNWYETVLRVGGCNFDEFSNCGFFEIHTTTGFQYDTTPNCEEMKNIENEFLSRSWTVFLASLNDTERQTITDHLLKQFEELVKPYNMLPLYQYRLQIQENELREFRSDLQKLLSVSDVKDRADNLRSFATKLYSVSQNTTTFIKTGVIITETVDDAILVALESGSITDVYNAFSKIVSLDTLIIEPMARVLSNFLMSIGIDVSAELITATSVIALDAILLMIILYQIGGLVLGSSHESLVPVVDMILCRREILSLHHNISIDDYYPSNITRCHRGYRIFTRKIPKKYYKSN